MRIVKLAFACVGALVAAVPSYAAFTTVNLDAYVNTNVAINPDLLPIGLSTGNQGTNIPFLVSSAPQNPGYSGVWLSNGNPGDSVTVDLSALGVTGQASFYALLNNYYGTPAANEYTITLTTLSGLTQSYDSIGSVDTRDYNAAFYTNTIANTTTEWYNNGVGQRYDVRTFTLPVSFASETITSFTVTQVHTTDSAIFAGLTFSTLQAGVTDVPEPATWAMMVIGFGAVGGAMRRRGGLVAVGARG